MPKDRRVPSFSSAGSRAYPYPSSSNNSKLYKSENLAQPVGDEREWEEVRCPICMEHPHNAVLLLCSSHATGCRPYMCDTSYRHSNCLDQFRKPSSSTIPSPNLSCPLCRGQINGWMVVAPIRRFMNSKPRICAVETCDYSGTYTELRKHARHDHPFVRPTEVDSGRQSNWMRSERERDLDDFLSASQLLESRWDWSDRVGLEVPIDDLFSVFDSESDFDREVEELLSAFPWDSEPLSLDFPSPF